MSKRERDIEKEKCGEIEMSVLVLCVRERERDSMCAWKREEREGDREIKRAITKAD